MARKNNEGGEGVRIDCEVKHETARALLVDIDTVGETWFPMSTVNQIHKQDGYIVVDRWIAEKLELI